MEQVNNPIDDYTLAAFIAGTLPEKRRAEVISYLAQNEEARELLRMAYQAMDVAGDIPVVEIKKVAPRPHARIYHLARYAAAALVIISLGFAAYLQFLPEKDELRSTRDVEPFAVQVEPARNAVAIQWNAVAEADRYAVVVWDINRAEVVARYEQQQADLNSNDPEMKDLATRLKPGRHYSVRVDAIDRDNRIVLSSPSTDFTAR